MQISNRSDDFHLAAGDPAQAVAEGAGVGRNHSRIGNGDDVALQLIAMLFEKRREIGRADFLLAFEKENQVDGKFAVGFKGFADTEDVSKHLTFVIRRTACPDPAIADFWRKRRRTPKLQGIGGLDIVVTVDQNGFAIRLMLVSRNNDRMSGCFMKLRNELHGGKFPNNPIRAIPHIVPVLGIGGDAGKREKGEKFFEIVRHAGRKLEQVSAGGKENGCGGEFSAIEENLTAKSAENAKERG